MKSRSQGTCQKMAALSDKILPLLQLPLSQKVNSASWKDVFKSTNTGVEPSTVAMSTAVCDVFAQAIAAQDASLMISMSRGRLFASTVRTKWRAVAGFAASYLR